MNENVNTLPDMNVMVKENISVRQWLTFYKNTWQRNLASRVIDMIRDKKAKEINPDEEVVIINPDTQKPELGTVKVRLEMRKVLVEDAIALVAIMDELLAIKDDVELAKAWSAEATAVAEDMKPDEEKPKVTDATVSPSSTQAPASEVPKI